MIAIFIKVQPICYSNKPTGSGVTCMLTGWGSVDKRGHTFKNSLKELTESTITNEGCEFWAWPVPISDTDICTNPSRGEG